MVLPRTRIQDQKELTECQSFQTRREMGMAFVICETIGLIFVLFFFWFGYTLLCRYIRKNPGMIKGSRVVFSGWLAFVFAGAPRHRP